MRFTKIKCNEEGVELAWTLIDANGATTTSAYANAAKPVPELPAALAAFKGFVIDLVGLPEAWRDQIVVTTLSLTEIKEGNRRGLQVSVKKAVERANGAVVSITTPILKSATENTTTDKGVYFEDVAKLIAAAEAAAMAYHGGERMQGEIFTGETAPAEDDVSKRRKKKPKDAGTPNEVMNRDKIVQATDENLRKMLLAVGRDVPADLIPKLTSTERDAAQRWAEAMTDVKAGTQRHIDDLIEPDWVVKYATPPLGGDGWTEGKPPKLDDAAVASIQASVEKA